LVVSAGFAFALVRGSCIYMREQHNPGGGCQRRPPPLLRSSRRPPPPSLLARRRRQQASPPFPPPTSLPLSLSLTTPPRGHSLISGSRRSCKPLPLHSLRRRGSSDGELPTLPPCAPRPRNPGPTAPISILDPDQGLTPPSRFLDYGPRHGTPPLRWGGSSASLCGLRPSARRGVSALYLSRSRPPPRQRYQVAAFSFPLTGAGGLLRAQPRLLPAARCGPSLTGSRGSPLVCRRRPCVIAAAAAAAISASSMPRALSRRHTISAVAVGRGVATPRSAWAHILIFARVEPISSSPGLGLAPTSPIPADASLSLRSAAPSPTSRPPGAPPLRQPQLTLLPVVVVPPLCRRPQLRLTSCAYGFPGAPPRRSTRRFAGQACRRDAGWQR
jgi:hypothetical protein